MACCGGVMRVIAVLMVLMVVVVVCGVVREQTMWCVPLALIGYDVMLNINGVVVCSVVTLDVVMVKLCCDCEDDGGV